MNDQSERTILSIEIALYEVQLSTVFSQIQTNYMMIRQDALIGSVAKSKSYKASGCSAAITTFVPNTWFHLRKRGIFTKSKHLVD